MRIDQYETGTASQGDEPFRAHYQLLDSKTPFRSKPAAIKTEMPGPQTAICGRPAW